MKNSKKKLPKTLAVWTDWNRPGAKGKYGAVGWYRIINPFKKLKVNVRRDILIGGDNRVSNMQKLANLGDVWVFKYVDGTRAVIHLLTARDVSGKKLLIDLDDDMFNIHPYNYAYEDHHPGSEKNEAVKYLIQEADGLICSTEPLIDEMLKYNANCYLAPNAIDPKIWDVPIKKNDTDIVRIGWILSVNHEQDIPVVKEALKEVLEKYPKTEFWSIGWDSDEFNDLPKKKLVYGTAGYKEYPKFLASLGIDISIAPLIEDKFNRSKSNIKWLESSMAEVPMVASDYHPYWTIKHGKTGFLAKNKDDWVKYLSMLVEDKSLRQKIAKNAKREVLKNWTVDKVLPVYRQIIKDIEKPKEPKITVVIPHRKGNDCKKTIESLKKQTYQGFKIVKVEDKELKGLNWGKNQGFKKVKTEFVLFSDDDIDWQPNALRTMLNALHRNPHASYAYGAYELEGQGLLCVEQFDPHLLRQRNFISTNSLIRTKDYPGADEKIKRLTDWDLWLTMLKQGKVGVQTGAVLFKTKLKKGISHKNKLSYEKAYEIVAKKHNLGK